MIRKFSPEFPEFLLRPFNLGKIEILVFIGLCREEQTFKALQIASTVFGSRYGGSNRV
jgi:hypothetical protein